MGLILLCWISTLTNIWKHTHQHPHPSQSRNASPVKLNWNLLKELQHPWDTLGIWTAFTIQKKKRDIPSNIWSTMWTHCMRNTSLLQGTSSSYQNQFFTCLLPLWLWSLWLMLLWAISSKTSCWISQVIYLTQSPKIHIHTITQWHPV